MDHEKQFTATYWTMAKLGTLTQQFRSKAGEGLPCQCHVGVIDTANAEKQGPAILVTCCLQ